jgi:hypothetical protein
MLLKRKTFDGRVQSSVKRLDIYTTHMPFRFQRITFYYRNFLNEFYANRPELASQSYAEQHAALMGSLYGYSDYWTTALRKLGYETDEVVYNAEPPQKRWAEENGIRYDPERWMLDIVFAQIKAFRPDVLYISSGDPNFSGVFVKHCREICPTIKLVVAWQGEPEIDASYFREYDLVLTCDPRMLAYLQSKGITAQRLHHGFEPRILEHLPAITPQVDVGFTGQIAFGDGIHNNRAKLFAEVVQQLDVTIYGLVPKLGASGGIRKYAREVYYPLVTTLENVGLESVAHRLPHHANAIMFKARKPYLSIFETLAQRAKPPVFGVEMYKTLAGFKVGLNAHGPSPYASNMRLYETTGVGTCLLTDWKQNLSELFEPDIEVVTYRSAQECVEKARYLLEHETERKAIAKAGQQRTLKDHTIEKRAMQLDQIICNHLRGFN